MKRTFSSALQMRQVKNQLPILQKIYDLGTIKSPKNQQYIQGFECPNYLIRDKYNI